MCPRESFNLPEKDISLDLLRKLPTGWKHHITLPLTDGVNLYFIPHLMDMIVYTKDKGHNVGVTTNGLLLAPFIEKFIEKALDKLTISLDSVEKMLK